MSNAKRKTSVFKLMVGVFVALLIVGYGWTRKDKPATSTDTATPQQTVASDDEQVKSLVVRFYKWKDENLDDGDFVPLSNDISNKYIGGIDVDKHASRLDRLRKSGFFTEDFLASYDSIAKAIDKKLKSGEFEWQVGDMPPFGNGANPWCDCQDYPSDTPWDSIVVTINSIDDKTASLSWTWGNAEWAEKFSYNVRAAKVDGSWRISYLQGFDYSNY